MSTASSPVRLVSTDFDGTLVEHGVSTPFSPLLIEIFSVLRERGVRWVVNTGRSLDSLEEGLESFAFPIQPDYVITTEREIFRPASARGWEDFGDWNTRCARAHDELFAAVAPALQTVVAFVRRETRAELRYGRRTHGRGLADEPAGIVACNDAEMDRIVALLDGFRADLPQFSYQRNSIYLSFCHADYDKGTALAELGRLLGVDAAGTFAVGDHQNDLPMLNGVHARHVACPANSIDQVKAAVRAAGGYVAREPYSAGVIEALRHYCGDLPGSAGAGEACSFFSRSPLTKLP